MSGPNNRAYRRPILLAAGGIFLVAGLALLGFGTYRIVDTEPKEEVVDLGALDADRVLSLATPSPKIPATPAPTQRPPLGDGPYTMTIDKIGVNAPVLTFGLDEEAVPEVPLNATDVAWYDFSARPGTGSNAVFAAHVTWNGNAVFHDLNNLEAGDRVTLNGADGTQVQYIVSLKFSVSPDDPESLKVMYSTDKDVITLITCGGNFTANNDPVFGGEYDQRVVVRADFVTVTGPGAAAAGGG